MLQLACEGDEREPRSRTLYAGVLRCAHGTGDFARVCFSEPDEAFMGVCREAIHAADLPPRNTHDHELLRAARRIAAVETERAQVQA